jgi:ParB family chromosome partitioning protein
MQLSDAKGARRRWLSSPPSETKKRGRPPNQTIMKIMHERKCSRAEAYRVLAERKLRRRTKREKLLAETMQFASLIKPSDNWDFAQVHYPRIDDDGTYGYIPGDLYANALFFFARHGDLVVAPMAGSGQIRHVYEDRAVWTKGLSLPWDIDLRMFDLTPRGPYASLISQWDLCQGFPQVERTPDYVIMDVPYLGLCRGQYSRRDDDLANMEEVGWIASMHRIARSCAEVQAKRCTIVVPTWVDKAKARVVHCPEIIRAAWRSVGYDLHRVCYASQRIQSSRNQRMPQLNIRAKATRTPLSDISEVLTFDAT